MLHLELHSEFCLQSSQNVVLRDVANAANKDRAIEYNVGLLEHGDCDAGDYGKRCPARRIGTCTIDGGLASRDVEASDSLAKPCTNLKYLSTLTNPQWRKTKVSLLTHIEERTSIQCRPSNLPRRGFLLQILSDLDFITRKMRLKDLIVWTHDIRNELAGEEELHSSFDSCIDQQLLRSKVRSSHWNAADDGILITQGIGKRFRIFEVGSDDCDVF